MAFCFRYNGSVSHIHTHIYNYISLYHIYTHTHTHTHTVTCTNTVSRWHTYIMHTHTHTHTHTHHTHTHTHTHTPHHTHTSKEWETTTVHLPARMSNWSTFSLFIRVKNRSAKSRGARLRNGLFWYMYTVVSGNSVVLRVGCVCRGVFLIIIYFVLGPVWRKTFLFNIKKEMHA